MNKYFEQFTTLEEQRRIWESKRLFEEQELRVRAALGGLHRQKAEVPRQEHVTTTNRKVLLCS